MLCMPGFFLTPLPHMGLATYVVAIPVNVLFYFGVTRAQLWSVNEPWRK